MAHDQITPMTNLFTYTGLSNHHVAVVSFGKPFLLLQSGGRLIAPFSARLICSKCKKSVLCNHVELSPAQSLRLDAPRSSFCLSFAHHIFSKAHFYKDENLAYGIRRLVAFVLS